MDRLPRHNRAAAELNQRLHHHLPGHPPPPPRHHMQHFQRDEFLNHLVNNRRGGGGGRRIVFRIGGGQRGPPVGPPPPRAGGGLFHHRAPYEPRMQRIKLDDDVLSYSGSAGDDPGIYIAGHTIEQYNHYMEVEILDIGDLGQICIGLVPAFYPLNVQPGVDPISVGYVADSGNFNINLGRGGADVQQQGPSCDTGDRMGVGVRSPEHSMRGRPSTQVFFTKNGQEVKSYNMNVPAFQLLPAVGMQSEGEEVRLRFEAEWNPDDGMQMMVDGGEEDWVRLDDIRLNGMTLEYTGKGRSIMDVGLAQAKHPLNTTNHFFEFEIVDPGDKCYVAIGLAKQNYPMGRHPGWNQNSIAYHADDGKLFHGSGMGVRFGPKCSMGDTMGCGILFPPDYDSAADAFTHNGAANHAGNRSRRRRGGGAGGEPHPDHDDRDDDDDDVDWGEHVKQLELEGSDDEDDDDDDYEAYDDFDDDDDDDDVLRRGARPFRRKEKKGTAVTVFFSRNGKLVGLREAHIPKGGFFPTIGMLSCNEKVRVDLRPLTG